jgi:hypothetical protein
VKASRVTFPSNDVGRVIAHHIELMSDAQDEFFYSVYNVSALLPRVSWGTKYAMATGGKRQEA